MWPVQWANLSSVLVRRGNMDTQRDTKGRCVQRKELIEMQQKAVVYKPRGGALGETTPANTLILRFQPPVL